MKKLIAQAALISTFALGAILGGGVALDSGTLTVTGPEAAEAMMRSDPTKCWMEGDESGWYKDGAWVEC
jgi:hypothetical protein